jgi:hypothetical protein
MNAPRILLASNKKHHLLLLPFLEAVSDLLTNERANLTPDLSTQETIGQKEESEPTTQTSQ